MKRAANGGGTIGGIQLLQIVEVLQALGVDRKSLRGIVGRDLAHLDDPWVRLPHAVAPRLFAHAERVTGDRLIGLHAGERVRFRGPIAHLFASAPRLRIALELYVRFSKLAVDTSSPRLEVCAETASLVMSVGDASVSGNRHFVDYTLMGTVRTGWRLPRTGFGLQAIHVRHGDRHYRDEARRAFDCPVLFGKPDDRIVFPASDLEAPLRLANALAGAQIEKALAALPATATEHDTFTQRVEEATRGLVVCGRRADRVGVARRLHVSVRSLQRRLEEEGSSFRAVRDGVLRALVEAQLWNPELSIKAIGLGLGFADAAALTKAFRRWTGQPPTRFRAQVLARAARRRTSPRRRR
jgi:AraC-like DNA-binding protein